MTGLVRGLMEWLSSAPACLINLPGVDALGVSGSIGYSAANTGPDGAYASPFQHFSQSDTFVHFRVALQRYQRFREPVAEIGCFTPSVAWCRLLSIPRFFKDRNARIVVVPGLDASQSNSRVIITAK
jgi:hypothetical protein